MKLALIFSGILLANGLSIIALASNWKVAIGVFTIQWSSNISLLIIVQRNIFIATNKHKKSETTNELKRDK